MPTKLLLNIQEVADLTGFSVGTLYQWLSQGRLPAVRLSARCVRFRQCDIEEWISQMTVAPNMKNISAIGKSAKGKKGNQGNL
jgi:excisionase family DNA binding protein